MRGWAAALIGLMVLGGAALYVLLPRDTSDPRVEKLSKRLAELESRPAEVRVEREIYAARASDEESIPSDDELPVQEPGPEDEVRIEADPASTPPPTEEEAYEEAAQELGDREAAFLDEARPAEAEEAERKILTAFQDIETDQVRLISARCRSATCRIEVESDSVDAYNQAFERLFLSPDSEQALVHFGVDSPMVHPDENGKRLSVIFMKLQPTEEDG